MRVLFYHSSPDWTGSSRAFADAGRLLLGRGYQVVFVCPPESTVEQAIAGERFEVIPLETDGSWITESVRLRQVLLDRFAEVVFVHSEREHIIAASAARMADRAAVVRRTPAGAQFAAGPPSRVAAWLAATGLVFTSTEERQSAPSLRGAPGADARAATVLRTVALLAPRHPELHLALLGAGSDAEDLRMHAAALNINRVVSHLGERDDQLAVLRAAQVGWVIADHDTGAYATLDLMALRRPVLVERGAVAGRYVADGITGVHLPPGDAQSTAAVLAGVLAREGDREAMGQAGRTRAAREYTERATVEALEEAIVAARDRSRW